MEADKNSLTFLKGGQPVHKINGHGLTLQEVTNIAAAGAAEKWHIPDEATLNLCIAYSKRLQKNHPDWDKVKIARKVAEKFKLTKNN